MLLKGVFLLSQPSFLIPKKSLQLNATNNFSLQSNHTDNLGESSSLLTTTKGILGFGLGIGTALFSSLVTFYVKKLNNKSVHYSVIVLYVALLGMPTTFIMSLSFYLTGNDERHPELTSETTTLLTQIAFALIGAVSGLLAQILFNVALIYEETSKICIANSTDILFIFIVQYFFLNVSFNILSLIGSVLIISATVLILAYKILFKNISKDSCCHKYFLFEF